MPNSLNGLLPVNPGTGFAEDCGKTPRIPPAAVATILRVHVKPSRFILAVDVASQSMRLFERDSVANGTARFPTYQFRRWFLVSTSRFGVGQEMNSNRTPLGLHRIARKVGGGYPVGTVFKSRKPIGLTWDGMSNGSIVHRILWLEGLEPDFNCGGSVDTFRRFVYIHGYGDETTLGRPQSCGCIHLAAADLMPLYERLPTGTLVWIG
jgi:hypothetical protein